MADDGDSRSSARPDDTVQHLWERVGPRPPLAVWRDAPAESG